MKKSTISDVAKKAGVSKAAVSFSINNRTSQLSRATREKIQRAIKDLRYYPSPSARNLAKGNTSLIGVVAINLLSDPFTEAIRGIEEQARRRGKSLLIGDAAGKPLREKEYATLLPARGSEGLIFVSSSSETSNAFLTRIPCPFVLINRPSAQQRFPSIILENRKPVKDIVIGLNRKGHTTISCFTFPPRTWAFSERLAGYRDAMKILGLKPSVYVVNPPDKAGGWKSSSLEHLLLTALRKEPSSALVACSDVLAHEIWRIALTHGIAIPRELSLSGFDNFREDTTIIPPLTTIRQRFFEAGKEAVEILLALIAGKKAATHIRLESEVIWRESVCER